MDIIIVPTLKIILWILSFYIHIIVIAVIFDWLRAFNIINNYNKFVYMIGNFLYNITNPSYRFIRRYIPPFGTLDLSPLVLILIIYFIQEVLIRILVRFI